MKSPKIFATSLAVLALAAPIGPAEAGQPKILVFAASSLAPSFTELGKIFENRNTGKVVQFSFQSSATLATQILAGAPVDIFASASETDMRKVAKFVGKPYRFTSNYIVLAVPKRAKIEVKKLSDINQRSIKWIQCAHVVPCGVATDRGLENYGKIHSRPVSYEANATSVLAKLLTGEVDAGFIYYTDYKAHPDFLNAFPFPDAASSKTQYFLSKLSSSKQPGAADSFIKLVLSPVGQAVLNRAGFSSAK